MTTMLTLPTLPLARYTFTLRMAEATTLPAYKGGLLRGGFGMTFRRSVCAYPQLPPCADCLLKQRCAYPPIFEPTPPADSEVLRTHSDIPRPFVLMPPTDRRTTYAAGDPLAFDLILIGSAIESLPYFIVTFQRLGEIGLGRTRAKYNLEEVTDQNLQSGIRTPLLQAGAIVTPTLPPGAAATQIYRAQLPVAGRQATLTFETPTALKHQDRIGQGAPPFHVLIRTLLRRVSSLSYFYGGQQWAIDYRGWIARAESVDVAAAKVQWVNRSRYSTRQQQRTDLSGIIGRVTYRGDLAPFLPFLQLGGLVHVGKNAVFGNGRYRVEVG